MANIPKPQMLSLIWSATGNHVEPDAARINTGDRYVQTAYVIKAKAPLQDRQFALALPNAE